MAPQYPDVDFFHVSSLGTGVYSTVVRPRRPTLLINLTDPRGVFYSYLGISGPLPHGTGKILED